MRLRGWSMDRWYICGCTCIYICVLVSLLHNRMYVCVYIHTSMCVYVYFSLSLSLSTPPCTKVERQRDQLATDHMALQRDALGCFCSKFRCRIWLRQSLPATWSHAGQASASPFGPCSSASNNSSWPSGLDPSWYHPQSREEVVSLAGAPNKQVPLRAMFAAS